MNNGSNSNSTASSSPATSSVDGSRKTQTSSSKSHPCDNNSNCDATINSSGIRVPSTCCEFIKLSEEERVKEFKRGFNESIKQSIAYIRKQSQLDAQFQDDFTYKFVNHLLKLLEENTDLRLEKELVKAKKKSATSEAGTQTVQIPLLKVPETPIIKRCASCICNSTNDAETSVANACNSAPVLYNSNLMVLHKQNTSPPPALRFSSVIQNPVTSHTRVPSPSHLRQMLRHASSSGSETGGSSVPSPDNAKHCIPPLKLTTCRSVRRNSPQSMDSKTVAAGDADHHSEQTREKRSPAGNTSALELLLATDANDRNISASKGFTARPSGKRVESPSSTSPRAEKRKSPHHPEGSVSNESESYRSFKKQILQRFDDEEVSRDITPPTASQTTTTNTPTTTSVSYTVPVAKVIESVVRNVMNRSTHVRTGPPEVATQTEDGSSQRNAVTSPQTQPDSRTGGRKQQRSSPIVSPNCYTEQMQQRQVDKKNVPPVRDIPPLRVIASHSSHPGLFSAEMCQLPNHIHSSRHPPEPQPPLKSHSLHETVSQITSDRPSHQFVSVNHAHQVNSIDEFRNLHQYQQQVQRPPTGLQFAMHRRMLQQQQQQQHKHQQLQHQQLHQQHQEANKKVVSNVSCSRETMQKPQDVVHQQLSPPVMVRRSPVTQHMGQHVYPTPLSSSAIPHHQTTQRHPSHVSAAYSHNSPIVDCNATPIQTRVNPYYVLQQQQQLRASEPSPHPHTQVKPVATAFPKQTGGMQIVRRFDPLLTAGQTTQLVVERVSPAQSPVGSTTISSSAIRSSSESSLSGSSSGKQMHQPQSTHFDARNYCYHPHVNLPREPPPALVSRSQCDYRVPQNQPPPHVLPPTLPRLPHLSPVMYHHYSMAGSAHPVAAQVRNGSAESLIQID